MKVLLLHGMGGTGALWRPVAASLEDRFSVLAPDQRGHGGSRANYNATYAPIDYGNDLVDTLGKLAFHPTWVVGHSMGVRSACAFAHLKPDWVQGLVLIDLGLYGPAGGGLGEELARFLEKLPMTFASRAEARSFMAAECPDPSIANYLMAVSVPAPTQGLTFPFDKTALIRTIDSTRDFSLREWIAELGARQKPILLLRGEKSQVWTNEEFEAERARFAEYPSIRFEVMAGAGHGLPFEKRAEFVARLTRFTELDPKPDQTSS